MQEENDCQQLDPMVKQAQEDLDAVGVDQRIGALGADAGYWSEANCAASMTTTFDLWGPTRGCNPPSDE